MFLISLQIYLSTFFHTKQTKYKNNSLRRNKSAVWSWGSKRKQGNTRPWSKCLVWEIRGSWDSQMYNICIAAELSTLVNGMGIEHLSVHLVPPFYYTLSTTLYLSFLIVLWIKKRMGENLKRKKRKILVLSRKEKSPNTLPAHSSNITHSWAHLTTSWLIPTLSTFPSRLNWT